MRRIVRWLFAALIVLALPIGLAGLSSVTTPYCTQIAPSARYDLALVLGAGTLADGRANSESRARTEAAVHLWQNGQVQRLLTSGRGPGSALSAAEAMRNHALSLGVPPGALTVETRSESTLENIALSTEHLAKADRVIMVTSGFHSLRAGVTMWLMGYAPEARCRSVPDSRLPFKDRLRISLWEGPKWWGNMARTALWRLADETGLLPHMPRVLWK